MSQLEPNFTLSIGPLSSTSAQPVGGPECLVVTRDMDIPVDACDIFLLDRSGVGLGDAVSLALGFDGNEKGVFAGTVAALQPVLRAGQVGVRITALGSMDALLNLRTAGFYDHQSAGAIAHDLIDQAGLSAGTIDSGPTLPSFVIDRRASAYVHLKGLANRLGYELYTNRHGEVMFHALGAAASLDSGGVVSPLTGMSRNDYACGKHLLDSSGSQRTLPWESQEVGGESPLSQQGQAAVHWLTTDDSSFLGSAGSGSRKLLRHDRAARSQYLADRFAAGYLFSANRSAYQVSFRVFGEPALDLGDWAQTSAAPDDLLNGQGYVRAICHRLDPRVGFVSTVRIALSQPA